MRDIRITNVVVLLIVFLGSVAGGQDYSSIFAKIDSLEARLHQLEMKLQPAGQPKPGTIENGPPAIEAEIEILRKEMADPRQSMMTEQELDLIKSETVEQPIQAEKTIIETTKHGENEVSMPGSASPGGQDQLILALEQLRSELRSAVGSKPMGQSPTAETEPVGASTKGIENIQPESTAPEKGFEIEGIALSGLFDVVHRLPQDRQAENRGFALGQLELDVESALSPYLSIAGALAYDGEAIGVGAAYVDLHWMDEWVSHPVHAQAIDHSGVLIGQFDVPFGADYKRVASPDRELVTPPLAVQSTVDGWNDLGVVFYGGSSAWEGHVYFVNGNRENLAYGTRLTISLPGFVELGGSYASVMDDSNQVRARLQGGDITFQIEPVKVIAEYMAKKDSIGLNQSDITGYYAEARLGFSQWLKKDLYLVGGYSEVKAKEVATGLETDLNRITIGAGYNIIENASLRVEYLIDNGDNIDNQNMATAQMVVSF